MLLRFLRSLGTTSSPASVPFPPSGTSFLDSLLFGIVDRLHASDPDNYDFDRFGYDGVDRSRLFDPQYAFQNLRFLIQEKDALYRTFDLLESDASKDWFKRLLLYRVLGHVHIRLPSNQPEHWTARSHAKALARAQSRLPYEGIFGKLQEFEVEFAGHKIVLDCWWLNIAWTFLFRQYYFCRDGARIRPESGDHVVDAGGCFGDTALAFSASVGHGGKVYCFEMDPTNLEVLHHNLEQNPELAERIHVVSHPLGNVDGTRMYLHGGGPAAVVNDEYSSQAVTVTTIDAFVRQQGLERIDFIKMDIEGAEFSALQGAVETLRRDRPKLAISIYHRLEHFASIPAWLDDLGLGYRFHLDHYTIHAEETILYASAR